MTRTTSGCTSYFKSGVEFAEFSTTGDRAYGPPHLESLGLESDQRFGETVLHELARNEIERRAEAFKEHRVRSLAELRERDPAGVWPRIVLVVDEFQGLLAGSSAATKRALRVRRGARPGRAVPSALILSCPARRSGASTPLPRIH